MRRSRRGRARSPSEPRPSASRTRYVFANDSAPAHDRSNGDPHAQKILGKDAFEKSRAGRAGGGHGRDRGRSGWRSARRRAARRRRRPSPRRRWPTAWPANGPRPARSWRSGVLADNPADEIANQRAERLERRKVQQHGDIAADVAIIDREVDVEEQHYGVRREGRADFE